jgi:outer membrane receptor protein involved in Fe transport
VGPTIFLRQADEDSESIEGIVRLEFDWTKISNHTIQANLEGAVNILDGGLFQTEDTGAGDEEVSVPGANSRVKETRGDFLLKDTWTLGSYELDYGFGAEVSKIAQTGDAELERSFTFIKPQVTLSYNSDQAHQTRMSVFREVAQLDFNDFISGNVFEDDDVLLGNPNLKPDTTWKAEVIHERRFGPESILRITAFHHWISDALDLLPLSETFEATGNIGDARRWGATIETTIPLEWLGLRDARLDIFGRWQDSSVTDPVTGEKRVLSDRSPPGRLMPLVFNIENKYAFSVDFRQDFQTQRVSWGWDIRERGELPRFRANEIDILDEDVEFNAFIETTRWFGLKLRFDAENIFDITSTRDRTRFTGARDLTPVRFREDQIRTRSFRFAFSVSGSF